MKTALVLNQESYFYPRALEYFLERTPYRIDAVYELPAFTDPLKERDYRDTATRILGEGFVLKTAVAQGVRIAGDALQLPLTLRKRFSIRAVCEIYGVPHLEFRSVNGVDFISDLRARGVTTVISACSQSFRSEVLSLPGVRFFRFHPSLLPAHQGPWSVFWAFLNQDRSQGMTVFEIGKSIDLQSIVCQREIPVQETDDIASMLSKMADHAADCLDEALSRIEHRKYRHLKVGQRPSFGPKPSLEDIYRYRRLLNAKRAASRASPKLTQVSGARS